MTDPTQSTADKWLGRMVILLVYLSCIGLFVADFMIHKHPHFHLENLPGFYAVFGFVAFIAIVWGGVQLRKLVSRDEDYYDRETNDA